MRSNAREVVFYAATAEMVRKCIISWKEQQQAFFKVSRHCLLIREERVRVIE